MSTEHEHVRELLAAWAVGALLPADERRVPSHLAECESCAAEAQRLRETVRLLDGHHRADGDAAGAAAGHPTQPGGASRTDGPASVLALALRSRPAAARVAPYAAPYAGAVSGLRALLRELTDRGAWGTPVVHDWDVHGTVAHLIAADEPLARRLGLGIRVPDVRSAEEASWEEAWTARTADVIAYEHGRDPEQTLTTWAEQAKALLAAPEARDPELAAHATMLMGVRLPVADHFVVRAFETWIHTDDIGRALGVAVPPPPAAHLAQLVRLAVRILGLALGPDAPPVLFALAGGDADAQWVLGSEDEPVRAELVLDPVDFCLLVGGRYAPEEVPRGATGDAAAVQLVLERAASLAWL
ncbi:maleylpyruvate isomerase family mycothiol-dependent enzyme [Streptomyces sp. SAS_270]|uniref:maleylpyruvate isomerase family mycothiol-dependent enzyme n=1 Tax=Streptomyces sp. SAS_270 TaxID=3412748 RepID=UPI00403C5D07